MESKTVVEHLARRFNVDKARYEADRFKAGLLSVGLLVLGVIILVNVLPKQ